jgi:hypothetical protein
MISADTVTLTLERLSSMSATQIKALADQMRSEQPCVMVYLLAISEREGFTEDESERFFYIGTVV